MLISTYVLIQSSTGKQEILKVVLVALRKWQKSGRRPLAYKIIRHLVIMEQRVNSQHTLAVKAYYKNGDHLIHNDKEGRGCYNLMRHGRIPSRQVIDYSKIQRGVQLYKRNHQEDNELNELQNTLKQFGRRSEGAYSILQRNTQLHSA